MNAISNYFTCYIDCFFLYFKTRLNDFSLEIWPGFVTSIRQYEHNIMMCIDVSHKVLRQDTVLDLMRSIKHKNRHDWKVSLIK